MSFSPADMGMGVTALPEAVGGSLGLHHSTPQKSSSPRTPKPAYRVLLPLRSPNKSHIVVPPMKPKSSDCSRISTKKKKRKSVSSTTLDCTTSDVLNLMDALCLPVSPDMYTSFIRECTSSAHSHRADDLHAHIRRSGLRQPPLSLQNRLLLMHVTCGHLDMARHLFDGMPSKDFKSWATIIVAYLNRDDYEEAMNLFLKMLHHVSMLEFPTWIMVCLLKSCICTSNMDLGKQVHGCSLKLGHANNLVLASSLINFYGKFRCLESTDIVFNQLAHHNSLTWIARLINNSREELFFEVFRDFREIGKSGIKKNALMFSSVLKACARMHDRGQCGRQVHANAIKLGLDTDVYVQCGLVDMYGRSGLVREAKRVFEMCCDKSSNACWNAMIGGYIRNGLYVEAIKFLYEMKATGLQLQPSLLDELRIACGSNTHSLEEPYPTLNA
ncbi:pentatricopeptide repeat-containing protein At1g31790-like [Humulus lupulus]|uniref:pentatricopeptide repeat-containing protein At1g31790-like n=1 Tax=Humulus lupulus TaxID=3486 RepID=UPI002B40CACD|nr:pentatricopeptide repeat-containing protein At1g31790-like [Humulus lupulus]XP_062101569.1 pentatricopeptide repeat-containing protein At1g31790-like [Humulus lupulus]